MTGSEKRRGRLGRYVYVACQLAHVLISLSFLAAAVVEFVAESPYFDVIGHPSTVPAQDLYRVSRGGGGAGCVHWHRIHPLWGALFLACLVRRGRDDCGKERLRSGRERLSVWQIGQCGVGGRVQ